MFAQWGLDRDCMEEETTTVFLHLQTLALPRKHDEWNSCQGWQ